MANTDNNNLLISVESINKKYHTKNGTNYIFKDLSFSMKKGDNLAIMGVNGAGKSTLINMISGTDGVNSGKITKYCSVSWPIGFSGNTQGSLTAAQNIKFVCQIFGLDRAQTRQKLDFCREFVQIGKYFDEPMKSYSSGMKARISFAMSMAFDFDLYLLDEITATGDQFFVKKSKAMLEQKMQKSNFIVVSHAIGDIKHLCNRFAIIYDKNMIFFDKFDEAVKEYKALYSKK